MADPSDTDGLLALTGDIVAAFVANNAVSIDALPGLIGSVHAALVGAASPTPAPQDEPLVPAVPIRKSITPDYLISLEDGRPYKSLKRHLRTKHDLTPEQYREKWGLPADYPMVAPNYARIRSDLAKASGLGAGGRKPRKQAAKET